MKRAAALGACLSIILCTSACLELFEPDWATQMRASQTQMTQLYARLKASKEAGLPKSELIMRVGQPTAKEVVEDGEIWIYQLNEQGATVSSTTYEPGTIFTRPTITTVTKSPQYSATITIRFDKAGKMSGYSVQGQEGALTGPNNRFLYL